MYAPLHEDMHEGGEMTADLHDVTLAVAPHDQLLAPATLHAILTEWEARWV
jgi:hypothetical protein